MQENKSQSRAGRSAGIRDVILYTSYKKLIIKPDQAAII